jgi:SAM-dependent methyltransferase
MLPSYIRLVASMHKRYRFEGPVCSLGNQDIWASPDDLKRCLDEVGCPFHEPSRIYGHSSRTFVISGELTRIARDFVHARTLFETLGIREYLDLDKFDSDNPALLHDLNNPIPPELEDRFGLVFDGGTIEHIFDVRQVMSNITRMLRPRGCVVHLCSFGMDHGFYAFSPGFFFDFYGANGFGEFECYLMEVDFSEITRTYTRRHRYLEYHYGMSLDGLLDPSKEILVFFAARKLSPLPLLTVPTQGAYERRGNLQQSPAAPRLSLFERVVPGWLQPLLAPTRPLLQTAYRRARRAQVRRAARIGVI